MNPIESAFDFRKSPGHLTVFGEYSITDTFYPACELSLGVSQDVDIDRRADVNVFYFPLTIVGDHGPLAIIDERKHRRAGSRIGTFGDIQVGHVGIEGRDNAAALEVHTRPVDPRGQPRTLGLQNVQGVDDMNRLPQLGT